MALEVGTNSYVTASEADTFLVDRYGTEDWVDFQTSDKEKALISALDIQENMCLWDGVPTSDDQKLHFPIDDETEVPDDIKECQIEIAFEILTQEVARFLPESESLKQLKAGSVQLAFFEALTDPLTVINTTVKNKLRKYGSCAYGSDSITSVQLRR